MGGRICRNHCPLNHGLSILFLALCVLCFLLYNNKMSSTVTQMHSPDHPMPTSVCSFNSLSPEDTSDPTHSTFTIIPRSDGGSWHGGDQLEVFIKMYDFRGRPKKSGGDFLLARLHNPALFAGVAGQVLDHRNGSYTAVFSLLWEGDVVMVHPSEQPDRIYFQSIFRSGSVTEITTCNICLKAPQQKLCNYTDLHTGEPWFCYKPKKLNCDTRITHAEGGFRQNLKPMEENLFKRNRVISNSMSIMGEEGDVVEECKYLNSGPAGYYYQVHQFNNATAISQCLKGKVLHLYGDSTVRQWFEFLIAKVPDLKKFDLKTPPQTGPLMALDYKNNILLTFRCHGPPLRAYTLPVSEFHFVANELDSVVGGANTVVIFGVWAHFGVYPVEVYIRRLLSIRRAVVRLLTRAPDTLVVIRTGNPKRLKLTVNDYYALQRDKILRAIFKEVNVKLLDAWEMTQAHYLPHDLHPPQPIIKNMIDVILSHVCPQR
uniref:NXPE C-terminal domain-containing protein n=1 Tax=Poecilia mexicana TaxID=48701 RepID=A0A3B3YPL2_9TELE